MDHCPGASATSFQDRSGPAETLAGPLAVSLALYKPPAPSRTIMSHESYHPTRNFIDSPLTKLVFVEEFSLLLEIRLLRVEE